MSRQTTISLVGAAAIGVALLGTSSAFAAPANGAAIGAAATSGGDLTEKVVWRGRGVGWRGVGWRGAGFRGAGWRGGWGWRAGWRPGWRAGWGWRPGLAAAGLATAGVASAAAYNYGYGDYGYGPNPGPNYGYANAAYYGPGAYYGYPASNYDYAVMPAYGYGNDGYGHYYGGYGQPGVGVAAAVSPAPAVTSTENYGSKNYGSYRRARNSRTEPARWTRGYCINAVHERLGVSTTDAAKDTNRDAVIRCMQRGPNSIG
jgi:hypothetical protein